MPHSEAQAWWADVQHVRESIERRRAGGYDSSAPVDAVAERRFARRADESLPPLDDLDWTSSDHPTGRFNRTGRSDRGDHAAQRQRRSSADRRGSDVSAALLELATDPANVDATPEPESSTTGSKTSAALSAPPRRTVQITGRTVSAPSLPRLVEVERRRPARRPTERVGPRPDRIALWAVLLGFFLILVAATSSNAAVHSHAANGAAVALHAPAR